MKKAMRLSVVMSLVFLIAMSLCTVAFASDNSATISTFVKSNVLVVKNNSTDKGDYTIKCVNVPRLKAYITTSAPKNETYTEISGVPTDDGKNDGTVYYVATNESNIVSAIDGYTQSKDVSNKVGSITDGFNITADTESAATMLSGFAGFMSLILGIIVYMIILFMSLFSAFDICYIAFPIFRNKCEAAKQDGNKFMTKTNKSGETSLRWVTDDAQFAVTQGTIDSGKNPWVLYFGKRVLTYILLALLLFILLTNNISILIQIAVTMVKGVFSVIAGLAS